MNPPPILLLHGLLPGIRKELAKRYTVVGPSSTPLQTLAESGLADRIRIAMTIGGAGLSPEIMAAMPALDLCCAYSAGYDRADVAALKARGIRLITAKGANASCVADMAMTLLLAGVRRLRESEDYIRDGQWNRVPPPDWKTDPGFGDRRLGVLGLGEIGLKTAKRAASFELEIGYHNRKPRRDVDYRYFEDLDSLAEWADYLVVACPLTEATRHAVNAKVLEKLGPRGFLVNVARGAIVDEAALVAALRSGAIAGAGLDVFEHEPVVPEALRGMRNVVLTPHMGALTERAIREIDRRILANLDAFETGKPLLTPVDLG